MSDGQNSEFAARLARIEQRKAQGTAQGNKPKKPRLEPIQSAAIRTAPENHRLRNGIIWVGILACIGGAGWYGANGLAGDKAVSLTQLAEATQQALGNLTGPMSMTSLSGPATTGGRRGNAGDAEPMRIESDTGWRLASPAVATPDGSEATLDTLVAGFLPPDDSNGPAGIRTFDTNTDCTLRRPAAGEIVVNVRLEKGAGDSQVAIFSKAELAEVVGKNIEGATTWNKPYLRESTLTGGMQGVDVLLTETRGPVYLVLQSMGQDIVWNIHPADGVTVAHVAMIGGNSGLVDMPENPTFEALRISDFVPTHEFGLDDEVRPCMIRPWRAPEAAWPAMSQSAQGNDLMSNMLHSYRKGHEAFAAWYVPTLGVDPDVNLTSAERAAHVLAGPLPATPVTYRSVAGRDIHLTRNDLVITGSAAARAEQIWTLQTELMTRAAGGDVSLLTPPVMEVSIQ